MTSIRSSGGMVGLDPPYDRELVDRRVDLAGGGDPGRLVGGELLPADLEDRVGIEPVERAERDELVVPVSP